jgi:hypothetical protein
VFGLNRGHSGEPTTAWPIGANSSATFVHHEYLCSHEARPATASRHAFQCRRSMSYAPRGQSVQIVDRTTSPPQVRTIPAAMQTWPRPDTVLKSSCRHRFSTPRFLPNRTFRWLHHIHPIHRHHTAPTHLQNRPICLFQVKIARMRRACWGSQCRSGRSQRRPSRFTLQCRRRPEHPACRAAAACRSAEPRNSAPNAATASHPVEDLQLDTARHGGGERWRVYAKTIAGLHTATVEMPLRTVAPL